MKAHTITRESISVCANWHAHAPTLAPVLPLIATDWAPPTLRGVAIAMLCVLVCYLLIRLRIVP